MPEIERPVRVFQRLFYCECGGLMKKTGTFPTHPPKYEYTCPDCGETARSMTLFPFIRYEAIEDDA